MREAAECADDRGAIGGAASEVTFAELLARDRHVAEHPLVHAVFGRGQELQQQRERRAARVADERGLRTERVTRLAIASNVALFVPLCLLELLLQLFELVLAVSRAPPRALS